MTTQTRKIIIVSVVLLLALAGYWLINRQRLKLSAPEEISAPPAAPKPLTEEEIAKIAEGLTASAEKELSLAQKQKIEKSVTAPSKKAQLEEGELEKLLQSLSAPQ